MLISDWSSVVCSSNRAVRHAHAAGGAVPGEEDVVRPVDLAQIRKLTVIGADHRGVELGLLGGIGDPTFTEALPSERRYRAGAQHRPHRHLEGASVRDRKSTRLNSSIYCASRMPYSACTQTIHRRGQPNQHTTKPYPNHIHDTLLIHALTSLKCVISDCQQ